MDYIGAQDDYLNFSLQKNWFLRTTVHTCETDPSSDPHSARGKKLSEQNNEVK